MPDTDRPQLPKRDWFTIEEVARRWGCTIEDLIDYGENEALRISVRPARKICIAWREKSATKNTPNQWTETILPLGLTPEDLRGAFGDGCRPYIVLPPVSGNEALVGDVILDFDPPQIFTAKDLVIVHEELDRFEREYRIGAHAGELPKPKPKLGERERQTLLALIGAMLETLVHKGPFKSQAELVTFLEDEYALPKRTTDGKFAEANRALQNK
ncbi:hypothetical protein [Extensimonas vulgaris]|uniref:Uncharacterized protein n=1 Tax=Extensimonas vulgaris TaxID=1031594 RepID=A0A369AR38_9BURK|nr:hypothetical protein [Extensimonas vulgaris]RCX11839.1 hypothetical protein DFR45_101371 [Extensimonas vulgaris]TWI39070.1 hypothetical protein IP95_01617 [Extensimonas vulgaris]TXD15322.1 hypothetical protein FUT63_07375 [Extensimonas vulgaris]